MRRKVAGQPFLLVSGRAHLVIRTCSQRVEPLQQLHLLFPARWFGGSGGAVHPFHGLALGFHIGSRIDIGRVEAFVAKPAANDCDVDARCDKAYGCGVPESMRGDSLAEQ